MKDFDDNLLKCFSLSLRIGSIEAGPPLSTILGNLGINTINFCKELNEEIGDLPNYFLLEVCVNVYSNRTFDFSLSEPTTSLLLRLVSFKIDIRYRGQGGLCVDTIKVVKFSDMVKISKFKFGIVNLSTLHSIMGTMFSIGLYVIEE